MLRHSLVSTNLLEDFKKRAENNYGKGKQDIVEACPPASMSSSSVSVPSVQNQNYTNDTGEQIETVNLQ